MARKIELTRDMAIEICAFAKMAVPQTTIAMHVGIDRTTLHRWVARGLTEDDGLLADFARDFRKAQAEAQTLLHNRIYTSDDPKCTMWMLERLYPQQYGKSIEVVMEQPSAPVIDASVTVRELEAELEALDGGEQ